MTDLPDKATPNWMVVATPFSINEAAIIVGRLKHLGVPAIIKNESMLGSLGIPLNGAVRVLVPEKYYDFSMAALYPDEDIPLLEDGLEDEEWDDEEDWDEDEAR
jgi:hypothetical protein